MWYALIIYVLLVFVIFWINYYLNYKKMCEMNRRSILIQYRIKIWKIIINSVFFPITIIREIIQHIAWKNSYRDGDD